MSPLAAELRKLWTVRTTWILTFLGWALVALSSAAWLFNDRVGGAFTGSDRQVADAIGQVGGNALIVLVVALLCMTTEFRHGTIGRTLQITPSRIGTLAVKLSAGVAYALAFFASGLAIVVVLLLLASAGEGVGLAVGGATATALWQGPVGLALNALLGVAVGALLRSQVVAITLVFVWLFVVENLVAALRPGVGRWLPFQALNALFLPGDVLGDVPGFVTPLDPPIALATFLTYVALATVAAATLLRTRDV